MMTVQSAIEKLKYFPDWNIDDGWLTDSEMHELSEMAISALEKQIPKKGIKENIAEGVNKGLHKYYCPICYKKGDLSNKCNVGEYCSKCGQKLDWSDTD